MSITVQLRRGTTIEHTTFTGAEGEVTVDITKKTLVVHDGSTAGGFPLAREDRNQSTLDPFKQGEHNGLNFVYGAGMVRADNVVSRVDAGAIVLADDASNYIECNTAGVVSVNTTGYTSGNIPIYKVVTAGGSISAVQDDRCFFNVGGDGGGGPSFLETKISPGLSLGPPLSITSYPYPT